MIKLFYLHLMLKETSYLNIHTILVWNTFTMDINDYGNYLFFYFKMKIHIDEQHTSVNPCRTVGDSHCPFPVFIKCSVTQSAEGNYSWRENLQNLNLWFSSNPSFPLYFWHT